LRYSSLQRPPLRESPIKASFGVEVTLTVLRSTQKNICDYTMPLAVVTKAEQKAPKLKGCYTPIFIYIISPGVYRIADIASRQGRLFDSLSIGMMMCSTFFWREHRIARVAKLWRPVFGLESTLDGPDIAIVGGFLPDAANVFWVIHGSYRFRWRSVARKVGVM